MMTNNQKRLAFIVLVVLGFETVLSFAGLGPRPIDPPRGEFVKYPPSPPPE